MQFPQFETPRLRLTQLSDSDSSALYQIFSDPEVVNFYDIAAFEYEKQALELIQFFNSRFDHGTGIRWGIRLRDTEELIGTCGFNSWNKKMQNAGIGYELDSRHWRKGYSTEALTRIITAAFASELPFGALNRIQADTMVGNIASESILTKLGFKEEGIRRESGYWKGQFHDLKCFGLLKSGFTRN